MGGRTILLVLFVIIAHLSPQFCRLQRPPQVQRRRAASWNMNNKITNSNFTYQNLVVMLEKKEKIMHKIREELKKIRESTSISTEVHLKMKVLSIYQSELQAAGSSLTTVLKDLNQTLGGNYSSINNIKLNCQVRQEDTRNAAILAEEDYNVILELEKEMKSLHPNTSLQTHFNFINEFLSGVAHAADTLESELMVDIFKDSQRMEGAGIETVVKLSGDSLQEHNFKLLQDNPQGKHKDYASLRAQKGGMSMLIDSLSNQYILSRPRDVTLSVEDHHFIHDIINLVLLSFLFGAGCSLVRVPSLFGYIFAGIVLGPAGFNWISSVVQVETLGEIGVIFIVFMVGLEFSPSRLRKVWNVAVYGGNLLLACSVLLAVLLGKMFQVHPRHSLFVAACLSFSSNPLATRIVGRSSPPRHSLLNPDPNKPLEDPELDIIDSVSGVLMMQDIQLGTIMALIPFLEGGVSEEGSTYQYNVVMWVLRCLQILVGFPALVVILRFLAMRTVARLYRHFNHLLNHSESILLASIALCFTFLLVGELLSVSMEMSSFLAGVVISSQGPADVDQVRRYIKPIRDLFSVFFFASLGFHVYPTFLRSEFTIMFTVMLCVVILKFCLSMVILGAFVGHCRRKTVIISVSLAQVSEFSFVLSSRARRVGIISREVYLVILNIATLSLLLSPLLWRLLVTYLMAGGHCLPFAQTSRALLRFFSSKIKRFPSI